MPSLNTVTAVIATLALSPTSASCKKKAAYDQHPKSGVAPPVGGEVFTGYGKDDRLDPVESSVAAEARTVAAVIPSGHLQHQGEGFELATQRRWREAIVSLFGYPPCDLFRFADEFVLPFANQSCSAIAVSSTVMLTARHCVKDLGPADDSLAFVFGFMLGSGPFKTKEVHRAVRVLARGRVADVEDDWALVLVIPPVHPTRIFTGSSRVITQPVAASAIGHPNHLGLIVSPGTIGPDSPGSSSGGRRATPLRGDLDIAAGSSGGPVLDNERHELIGIVYYADGNNPPMAPPPHACVQPRLCQMGTIGCKGMLAVSSQQFGKALSEARANHP